jgi:hypothetical protein
MWKFLSVLFLTLCICLPVKAEILNLNQILEAACRISSTRGGPMGTGTCFAEGEKVYYVLTNAHVVSSRSQVHLEFFKSGDISKRLIGNVTWHKFVSNTSTDLAVITVSKSYFGSHPPRVIPLAPANHIVKKGDYIASAGCPEGRWAMAWEGHAISREGQSKTLFVPAPVGGQSGSGIIVLVPNKDDGYDSRLGAVLTWRLNNHGGAVTNQTIHSAMYNTKHTPTRIPSNYKPISTLSKKYALGSNGCYYGVYPLNGKWVTYPPTGVRIIGWPEFVQCPPGGYCPPDNRNPRRDPRYQPFGGRFRPQPRPGPQPEPQPPGRGDLPPAPSPSPWRPSPGPQPEPGAPPMPEPPPVPGPENPQPSPGPTPGTPGPYDNIPGIVPPSIGANLQKQVEELKNKIKVLEGQKIELKAQLEAVQEALDTANEQNDQLLEERKTLAAEYEALNKQLEALKVEYEALKVEADHAQLELNNAQDLIKEYAQNLQNRKIEVDQLNSSIENYQIDLNSIQKDKNAAINAYEQLVKSKSALDEDIGIVLTEKTELKEQNTSLKQQRNWGGTILTILAGVIGCVGYIFGRKKWQKLKERAQDRVEQVQDKVDGVIQPIVGESITKTIHGAVDGLEDRIFGKLDEKLQARLDQQAGALQEVGAEISEKLPSFIQEEINKHLEPMQEPTVNLEPQTPVKSEPEPEPEPEPESEPEQPPPLIDKTPQNDYATEFFLMKRVKDNEKTEHWALLGLIYVEAMQLLRNGVLYYANTQSRLQGQVGTAHKIEDWVRNEFGKRFTIDELRSHNKLYHEAMLGFLYKEAIERLRAGLFDVLGAEATADAIQAWVAKEFVRRVGKTI